MKLQNTENPNLIADLQNAWSLYDKGETIVLKHYGVKDYEYNSLSELYKEWKDYEPLLPVEIREGLKQWAMINNVDKVTYHTTGNDFSWFVSRTENIGCVSIDFNRNIDCLEDNKDYTVQELVGE